MLVQITVCVGLLVIIGITTFRYANNVICGPFAMDAKKLVTITQPDLQPQYYVTVTGTKPAIETPFREYMVRKSKYSKEEQSREISAYYMLLPVEGRLLTVKVKTPQKTNRFTGELKRPYDGITKEIAQSLDEAFPNEGVGSRVLPITMEIDNDFGGPLCALVLPIGIILFLILFMVKKIRDIGGEPHQNAFGESLKVYGAPRDVIAELDQGLKSHPIDLKASPLVASIGKWFLLRYKNNIRAYRDTDLIWIYRSTTSRNVMFVPINKQSLVICTRDKKRFEIPSMTKTIEKAMDDLSKMSPWAIFGYNSKTDLTWQGRPQDVIAEVETRNRQYKESKQG